MNEINSLLTNQLSSIVMAGAFIFYLMRRDRLNKDTFNDFNRTIQNHLKHARKTETELAKSLQRLGDTIESLERQLERK